VCLAIKAGIPIIPIVSKGTDKVLPAGAKFPGLIKLK